MTDTNNFFKNPNEGSNSGWGAGIGGLIGAAVGSNGGFFGGGNREPSVTPDQLGVAVNGLRTEMQAGQLEEQIAGVTATVAGSSAVIASQVAGVKDAVACASSTNQLALCGLGHTVQAGFAQTNQTILLQGAASRELALQQALDAERARATEYRIALSEAKNDAGHAATRVLLNQVINVGGGTGGVAP